MPTQRQDRQSKRSSHSIGWLLAILLVGLFSCGLVRGQAITSLGGFRVQDGAFPTALVQGSDGNFYGTTATGTAGGGGSVFKMTPQGYSTILYRFGVTGQAGDGLMPTAGLVEAPNGNLYGTTSSGGVQGNGRIFLITSSGQVDYLHDFGDGTVANDGTDPMCSLLLGMDGNLYGTTSRGGSAGKGTVFAITPLGVETIIHSFGDGTVGNDGTSPTVGLAQDAQGNLYGTTSTGGLSNQGVVYKLDTQKRFSILYNFNQSSVVAFNTPTSNSTSGPGGCYPNSRLLCAADGNLYGTTAAAPGYGYGTIYKLTPQGQETVLHYFGDGTVANDGQETAQPVEHGESALVQSPSSGNFYGTTDAGGVNAKGVLFEMTPAGQVTILHSFGDSSVPNDGTVPISGVILGSDGNLYGTTGEGGSSGWVANNAMAQAAATTADASSDGVTVTVGSDGGTGLTTILADPLPDDGSSAGGAGTVSTGGTGTGEVFSGGPLPIYPGTLTVTGTAYVGTVFRVQPAAPAFASNMTITSAAGVDLTYQIVATQSPISYTATGLPAGLSINQSSGLISGAPLSTGISNVTVTATNAAGLSSSATLIIAILPPPAITSILTEFGSTSGPFAYQITATESPTSFNATGLPSGLSVDTGTGIVSGTPLVTGTFSVGISATNVAGTDNRTLTLVISAAPPALSQEYVQIHNFQDGSVNGEGAYPGMLIQGPASTLYGVTAQGGAGSSGTIFGVSGSGTGSLVSTFGGDNGATPQGLVLGSDGNYYGTTQYGGTANQGTFFQITPKGAINVLHNFGDGTISNDGTSPQGGLIAGSNGWFFGVTQNGGAYGQGTLFRVNVSGSANIIYSFGYGSSDGTQPVAGLLQGDDGNFYGVTLGGGSANDGTVFSYSQLDVMTTLHSFGATATDGQMPRAPLIEHNGNLYGTTTIGGTLGKGTLFEMSLAGVETILHNFGDGSVANDGINPIGSLVAVDRATTGTTLFGTTQNGGAGGAGAIFEFDASNTLTILHSFDDGSVSNDGQIPLGGLCLGSDGNLYGTTVAGGTGSGTVFAIVANLLPPPSTPATSNAWTLTGTLPTGMTFDSTTGAILGTPNSSDSRGTYTVSVTSPENVTTTQTYALTQTFAEWATAKGNANLVVNAAAGDGVANALKYLFDINPNAPMTATDHAAMPTGGFDTTSVPGTPYVTLTYRENAAMTGMTVTLETSDDMQTWSPVPTPSMLSKQIGTDTTTPANDPIMEVGAPADGSPSQFVRLKVTPQ